MYEARVHRDRLAGDVLLEADGVERRATALRHCQVNALAVHQLLRPRVYAKMRGSSFEIELLSRAMETQCLSSVVLSGSSISIPGRIS